MAGIETPLVEFQDVSIRLGGRQILDRLSFRVERGERFVILGYSGSGKSVTLKNMTGLMKPDTGSIRIDGAQIVGLSEPELEQVRKKFGYLFQSGALINWLTIFENVDLPLREHTSMNRKQRQEVVMEKLRLVSLQDDSAKYPADLSGGMKKRAALARAIVLDPEMMLFDEPTSGLDPVLSRQIDDLIVQINEELKVTCVVVTHDLESAADIGQRVAFFNKGKMHCILPPNDFMDSRDPEVVRFVTGGRPRYSAKLVPVPDPLGA
jgi:phospholipid/cholesterol/gamma-HCH transport system ATP-binding protein